MDEFQTSTFFAPAERASSEELARQVASTLENPITGVILEAVSGYILILNSYRQILAANQEVLQALETDSPEMYRGLRPGEIFNCAHVAEGPGGCGTSPHCKSCGAVLSILLSQSSGLPVEEECHLSIMKDGQFQAADFKVKSTPIKMGDDLLTVVVFQDISAFKRREILEKVFLHDFFNTVGGIQGWSEQLKHQGSETAANQIFSLATQLKEEIRFQSLLVQAENMALEIELKPAYAGEILDHLRSTFILPSNALARRIYIQPPVENNCFYTDPFILVRILINMVKNALEATPLEGGIRISYEMVSDHPTFRVHNEAFILPEVQEHIFERSFSTKGDGRGVGTYSMKLFGEQYLKGRVSFTSTPQGGTTFTMQLPRQDSDPQKNDASRQMFGINGELKQGKKVLLVEDDESHALLGSLLLERMGFNVEVSDNGEDAIRIFAADPDSFLFVMTDYTMEPLNGLDTARHLLRIKPSAIILLCTGRDDPNLIREARAAGVRATSLKPSNQAEMEDLLVSAGLSSYTD